jgi:hypothetical protein
MKRKEQIQLLVSETGCEESEAKFALFLSGGNIEAAITKLGVLLKYITAFKIKLILPEENVYGLMQIAVNMKSAEILRSSAVLSHNPSVYEISSQQDWFSFEKAIFSARLDCGTMEAYTQSVEEDFENYAKTAVKELSEISSQQISKIIKKFFSPKPADVETVSEELSVSQFKKLPDFDSLHRDVSFTGYDLGFVQLDAEILEDKNGKTADKISEGDAVLSLITDTRDIAHYIANLIGAKKDASMIPIISGVKKVFVSEDGICEIHLTFAPSITGLVKVQKDKVLKVLESKNRPWWRKIMPW